MGPPAVCVRFEVPDEDEAQPEDIKNMKDELAMVCIHPFLSHSLLA